MASTIADFALPIKKMSATLGISNNYAGENNYNSNRSNPNRIAVTVDNTGKSVKTNYLVNVVWDTQTRWYVNNDISWNLNDLRVYDSDGITPLSFWVDGVMTSYTCVFVVIPSLSAASKTIYFEFGNPALPSLSNLTATLGSVFADSNLGLWYKSTQNSGYWQNDLSLTPPNPAVFHFNNAVEQQTDITLKALGKRSFAYNLNNPPPTLFLNQQNGLPFFTFTNSVNETMTIANGGVLATKSTCFAVFKNSASAGSKTIIGGPTGAFQYRVAANKMELVKRGVSSITGSGTLTLASNTYYSANITWDAINYSMRLNGAIDKAGANATTITVNSTTISDPAGEYFDSNLGEILYFSRVLSDAEILIVENYLNAKFRLYSTSDMPSISVGSKTTTGYANYTYLSYASTGSWQSTSKLSNGTFGVAETTGTSAIQNVFNKTLATGTNPEGWTNSNQNTEKDQLTGLITQMSRTNSISTSPKIDTIDIRALNLSSNDINTLASYDVDNEVVTSTYSTSNNDYIELDAYFDGLVGNIDLTNSYIQVANVGNTANYKANLTKNQNILTDGASNKIKIKMGDFTLTGSDTWANMKIVSINFQTTTGTQNVYYGNLRLNKNVDQATDFVPGTPIQLGYAVSSDDGATYFTQPVLNGTIDTRTVNQDDVSFTIKDYLEYVKTLTFGDLPSFPEGSWQYGGSLSSMLPNTGFSVGNPYTPTFPTYGGVNITIKTWLTILTKQLFAFIFPSSFYDINLEWLADDIGDDTIADFVKNGRYTIYSTDKIGDVLNRIINACLGYIAYDPITAKLIVRNGYRFWDNTNYTVAGNQLHTAFTIDDNLIDDYLNDQTSTDYVINRLKFKLNSYSDLYIAKNQLEDIIRTSPNILIPVNGLTSPTKIYFQDTDFLKPYSFNLLPQFFVLCSGITYAIDTTTATTATSSTFYASNWGIENGKIFVEIVNSTPSSQYLRTISFQTILQKVINYPLPKIGDSDFQYYLEDSTSQSKYGLRELEIDPDFGYYNFVLYKTIFGGSDSNIPAFQGVAYLYNSFLREFKDPHEVVQLKVFYIPNLRLGQLVKVKNRQGRLITGNILALEHYSEGVENMQTVTVREINAVSTMVNPYFTALYINGPLSNTFNSYISLPALGFSGNANISVESWIYLDNSTSLENTVFSFSIEGTTRAGFGFKTGSVLRDGFIQLFNWVDDCNSSARIITKNTWCHVACTYEASTKTRKIYFNGNLVVTSIAGANLNLTNASYSIGKRVSNVDYFTGFISDLRVWNTTRTATEILTNYKKRLAGNETGLKAYYKLNETSGSTASDSTSNAFHGTLTNFGATPKRVPFINFFS